MTREVTELIDGAIRDWEASADAMRWTPEPPGKQPRRRTPTGGRGFAGGGVILDEPYRHTAQCLFVGGPWHGQLHGVHRSHRLTLPETVNVLDGRSAPTWQWYATDPVHSAEPQVVRYQLSGVTYGRRGGPSYTATYWAPGATGDDLRRAIGIAA